MAVPTLDWAAITQWQAIPMATPWQ
jgi:hypothetical protein